MGAIARPVVQFGPKMRHNPSSEWAWLCWAQIWNFVTRKCTRISILKMPIELHVFSLNLLVGVPKIPIKIHLKASWWPFYNHCHVALPHEKCLSYFWYISRKQTPVMLWKMLRNMHTRWKMKEKKRETRSFNLERKHWDKANQCYEVWKPKVESGFWINTTFQEYTSTARYASLWKGYFDK